MGRVMRWDMGIIPEKICSETLEMLDRPPLVQCPRRPATPPLMVPEQRAQARLHSVAEADGVEQLVGITQCDSVDAGRTCR